MGQQHQVTVVPKNNAPANAPTIMVQLQNNGSFNYVLAWSDTSSNMWSTSCPAVQGQTGYAWTKPIQIPGGTSAGPAVAGGGQRGWAAWKGQGGDERIFLSSLPGSGGAQAWAATGAQILGIGTSAAPALAAIIGGPLILAWKGIPGDNTIYWSQSNNDPNSPSAAWGMQPATQTALQTQLQGAKRTAKSTDTPALAICYPNQAPPRGVLPAYVLCAWKGQGTPSDQIYAAVYNLSLNNTPTWTPLPIPPQFLTEVGPAVGFDYLGNIHLAWKGGGGPSDHSIWTSSLQAQYWQGLESSSNVMTDWTTPGAPIPVIATAARPALTDLSGAGSTQPDQLLAWQGHKSPFELWVGPLEGLIFGV